MFEAMLSAVGPAEESGEDFAFEEFDPAEVDQMIQDAEAEIDSLEELDTTITDLDSLSGAIEAHGMSQSLIAFADHGGLLSSAAILPSVEAFGETAIAADDAQAVASVESIGEKIKELAAAFIGKISEAGQKIFSAVTGFFKGIYNKAATLLGRTQGAEETSSEVKSGMNYAVASAGLAALVAIPAVIASVVARKNLGAEFGVKITSLQAVKDMLSGGLTKLGKVPGMAFSVGRNGAVKVAAKAGEAKTATLKALGWSKGKLTELLKKCADMFRPGGALFKAANSTWTWIKGLGTSIKAGVTKAAAKAAGAGAAAKDAVKSGAGKAKDAAKAGAGKVAAGAKAAGGSLRSAFGVWRAGVRASISFCWSMLRSVAGSIWSLINRCVASVSAGFKGFKAAGAAA